MEERDQTPPGWHDIPTADPQIQKDYEAALGAFLVTFNRIENITNEIIHLALYDSERPDILQHIKNDSFSRRLVTLDLLSLAFPRPFSRDLIDKLRQLANARNRLAHGHFDQNPFDGEHTVVTSRNKRLTMPVTDIQSLTRRAEAAWDKLGYVEAFFWFDDLDEKQSS